MNIKKRIISIGLSIFLVLITIPTINSEILSDNFEKSIEYNIELEILDENSRKIELSIYHCKADGSVDVNNKIITFNDKEELIGRINQIAESKKSIKEIYENEIQILKDYNLIPNEILLDDIIDLEKIGINLQDNILGFDNVTNQNFLAHFAPVLVIGGGFGLGLGMPGLRTFNGFTSLLTVVAGLGFVMAIDFFEQTIYTLFTYLLPLLIGYFAGYMGFIIFAVEPGTFYSNLVMLGFSPMTAWIQIPDISR
jgi:hypothetical protein